MEIDKFTYNNIIKKQIKQKEYFIIYHKMKYNKYKKENQKNYFIEI